MGSVSTIYNGVRTWLAGRALMDVALSDRSTNGVQNKIIKAKFDEVEDSISQINSDLTDFISEFENGVTINATNLDYNDALYALNNAINRNKLTGNSYIVVGTNIFKCCVNADAQTRFINHNYVDGTGERDLILTVATAEAGCRYITVTNGTATDNSGITVGQDVTLYYR